MRVALVLTIGLLAACGSNPPGIKPVAWGSRADGYVAMSSTGNHYNPVGPDWKEAAEDAGRRCRSWGYSGIARFAGWREACRVYDRYGRCARSVTTRYYTCGA